MTLDLLKVTAPKPVLVPFAKAAGLKPVSDLSAAQHNSLLARQNSSQVSQMVVQWQGTSLSAQLSPSRHSADYLVAMHDLVRQVAQLQAAHGTASASSLSEIAADVALKQADWQATAERPSLEHQTAEWKTLASGLLWRIAQSTHEALQLIEGSPAQVSAAGQWQSGMLRLVVLLDLEGEQSGQTLDLVMAAPSPDLLPAARLLQITSLLSQQPISVIGYLQQLTRQLATAAPILREFFEGYAASWLMPHRDWQTGRLKLRLGLAFSPEPQHVQPPAELLVTFTQPNWLEQHMSVAVAQQLTQILLQVPPVAETPEAIIQRAQTAIHDLQNSLTLASRTFAQQAVTLEALAFRLLWGINRTAYEVMQLTSALPARLLRPQQGWVNGSLRLALYLEVRTPQRQWQFDLARRAEAASGTRRGASEPLAANALVQSHEHLWCLQPVSLSSLAAQFWQQVEQLAPEIALLRTSTEVNISAVSIAAVNIAAIEMQNQHGVVQLKAGFEFS